MSRYHHASVNGSKSLIIDAGANIGASVVWFSQVFPESHIVAFEPDVNNFELLKRNTEGLDVELHNAAIGPIDGNVSIQDPGEGEWGYRTKVDVDGGCAMVGLDRIFSAKLKDKFEPYIVKIDIEGAEDELFSDSTEWIDRTPIIIIELHDWLLPKKATSRNFLRAICKYDRDFVHIGENIFSMKNYSEKTQ